MRFKTNKDKAKLVYRIIYVALALVGQILASGLTSGKLNTNMFLYFTNLSNLLCLVFFAVLVIRQLRGKSNEKLASFKGMATMGILTTFLIYHFMLRPLVVAQGSLSSQLSTVYTFKNLVVHYFVPILALLDWFMFDEKGRYTWIDPLRWPLLPAAYFAFALIRAPLFGPIPGFISGSRYPYPFIDVDVLGWGGVAKNAAVILVVFVVAGYLYVMFDHALAKLHRRRTKRRGPDVPVES